MDAQASRVDLQIDRGSFVCTDDGAGFASLDAILRYFGRFGTPHEEGDATYGRFRLGRGQIMAHARTVWRSHRWQMTVDTQEMGYGYDLETIPTPHRGCHISGSWYQPMTECELGDVMEELRHLVRYTRIPVVLNGNRLSRDAASESWDTEDAWAYYRAREQRAVAIYNQEILVRDDAAHIWGCGGIIVTKQALGLNVSRTEILRKTDPVWKAVAKTFQSLADRLVPKVVSHQTEAFRDRVAYVLVSNGAQSREFYYGAPVVNILPGKRHVSLSNLRGLCGKERRFTVVTNPKHLQMGEVVASDRDLVVLHPLNLDRFRVEGPLELETLFNRMEQKRCDEARQNPRSKVTYRPFEAVDFETVMPVTNAVCG